MARNDLVYEKTQICNNLFVLSLTIFCTIQVELHVCEHCLTKELKKNISELT